MDERETQEKDQIEEKGWKIDQGESQDTVQNKNENTEQEDNRAFLKKTGKICSHLGFGVILVAAVSFLFSFFWSFLLVQIKESQGEVGRWLADLLIRRGAAVALASLSAYLVSLPLLVLFLKHLPQKQPLKMKMRCRKFLMFFVLSMGLGYIGSFGGAFINQAVSAVTGKPIELMNPSGFLLSRLSWPNLLYIAVLGPVIEEWIFRKEILNRVRFLGEGGAIVFTAVLFGLLHGNVSQTIFATVIGLIFGYTAVKTGRIFYSVLLHILVNSYSVVTVLASAQTQSDNLMVRSISVVLLGILGLSVFVFIIGAVIILIVKWKQAVFRKAEMPAEIRRTDLYRAVYLNPGMVCMYLYCLWQTVDYLFL